jgi:type 1 fimbria pilin
MKLRFACLLLALIALIAGSAAATGWAAAPAAAAPAAAPAVTVTGEVIDSACYIKDGSKGPSHAMCAQACADAGVPLAILEDGTNKVVWVASKADAETPNKQLKPYAGKKVTVKGTYAERGGAKILLVDSVAPAKGK